MWEAISEARKAQDRGEVPVGAVVVFGDTIVGRGHNLVETSRDPTAHAEIVAIREAVKFFRNKVLPGCSIYVTVEPCAMCAGAIVLAKIEEVVFGARDPKGGAGGSIFNILQEPRLNHRAKVVCGVLEDECKKLLQEFFRQRRSAVRSQLLHLGDER
ncbi:MAG: tRNA adenosine(34) deaminase TadA [bacterium]